MVPKEQFVAFISQVVETCLPDEVDAYEFGGSDRVSEVYDSGKIPPGKVATAEFEFMPTAKCILDFLKVAYGTFIALRELYRQRGSKQDILSVEVIGAGWSASLKVNGVPAKIADKIVAEFGAVLTDLINAKSP